MKILVIGSSGMAGHTIYHYLKQMGHDMYGLSRAKQDIKNNIICDVFDTTLLAKIIEEGKYDYLINCVGILTKEAEDNKNNAVFLNSYLPHFLCKKIQSTKTRLIHMSTDCVFSGAKGGYNEKSFPDGEAFYDRAKALGEVIDNRNLTFRNSIIGPDINRNGIGLLNWFMQQTGTISGWTKSIWSGVTTITLAKAMHSAMQQNLSGLYHLTNNTSINKYELLGLFNKHFNKNLVINKTDGVCHDKTLINTRTDFDFKVPSYNDMVAEMKNWIYENKNLYPHYFSDSISK